MGVKGKWRHWYTSELDDGRDIKEIRAWLNYGMKLIETRLNIKVKDRKVWREISRTGSQNYFWVMRGRTWEPKSYVSNANRNSKDPD